MHYIGLSARQAAMLDYIKETILVKGYPPTIREIGQAMGLSSPSTVHSHLTALEKKGYIKRDASKPRALEICNWEAMGMVPVEPPNSVSFNEIDRKEIAHIPIVGKITAGQPILAVENIEESFPMPLDFIRSNKELFILQVDGESMIEAGILDGDYIVIEKTATAYNGEIVAALIDDSATVKRFFKENGHYRLQPENSTMEPIIVDQVTILGRVIALFRHL